MGVRLADGRLKRTHPGKIVGAFILDRPYGFAQGFDTFTTIDPFRHEDSRLSWAYRVPVDGSEQTVWRVIG